MMVISEIKPRPENVNDFLRPAAPSQDPAYLAWRDAKIKRALAAAEAAPEKSIPQRQVWKKFGLEY